MIDRQKKEGEKVNVTTILFDDKVEIIHDRFPIEVIQPLTEKEYYVRGCTALLDAVGQAIKKIDNVQKTFDGRNIRLERCCSLSQRMDWKIQVRSILTMIFEG